MFAKIKEFANKHQEEIILLIGVILVSSLSFALGHITALQEAKEPIRIEQVE